MDFGQILQKPVPLHLVIQTVRPYMDRPAQTGGLATILILEGHFPFLGDMGQCLTLGQSGIAPLGSQIMDGDTTMGGIHTIPAGIMDGDTACMTPIVMDGILMVILGVGTMDGVITMGGTTQVLLVPDQVLQIRP